MARPGPRTGPASGRLPRVPEQTFHDRVRGSSRSRLGTGFGLSAVVLGAATGLLAPAMPAAAQIGSVLLPGRSDDPDAPTRRIPITGDRLSGFALPITPITGDVEFEALRANRWRIDDTRRLRLEGDVDVRIGPHRYRASAAVIWLNRLPTDDGVVNQIAVWFDDVENLERPTGVGVAGRRLLVTAATRGGVRLTAPRVVDGRPRNDARIRTAEDRLRRHLVGLQGDPPRMSAVPRIETPADAPAAGAAGEVELPSISERRPWLRAPGATVTFSARELELETGETENIVRATGGFVVEYFADDDASVPSQLTLTAQRAVVFTEPGAIRDLAERSVDASSVRGIYLEGDVRAVADRGEQTLRAPRVYYDFETGRAIMLEAVLRTYDRDGRTPIYARAQEMRQVAEDQFEAKGVRVTASEYAIGHLAIGASRMTLEQRPVGVREDDAFDDAPGLRRDETAPYLTAEGVTLQLGGTPVLWWPKFSGRATDVPLRGTRFGVKDRNGVELETRWDLQALLGGEREPGLDAELRLDGYTERGAGAGLVLTKTGEAPGSLELMYLRDDGEDLTEAGRRVQQDDANRGLLLYEQRFNLGRSWALYAQGSYTSDPTYVAEWRRDDYRNRREYETGARAVYRRQGVEFSVDTTYRVEDHLSNGWLIAGPGYSVDRMPEVRLSVRGGSLFSDRLTSHTDLSYGRVRLRFNEVTAAEAGVRAAGFGLMPNEALRDLAFIQGLESGWVHRADLRQEFSVPYDVGPVRVVPFVVGRVTAWDDDFAAFAPQQEDTVRAWGAIGVRASTQFQRVWNDVRSLGLDLDRLRWVIEPSATVMYAHSGVDQTEVPIYDPEVESLATGAVAEFGLRHTLQTYRGGPGRKRSTDVLVFDTRLVTSSGDQDRESPTPRFIWWRPEQSQAGDHVRQLLAWRISDSISLTGETIYDFDTDRLARSSLGISVDHSPLLTSWVEFRRIDSLDSELIDLGWRYRISPKYRVSLTPTWDVRRSEFRSISARATRSFPDVDFSFVVNYDEISDDTTFGARLGFTTF